MPNTDITLTRILTAENYALLQAAINRRWPYESEIPDPDWVSSVETSEQPMITNPITNQKHVENMIAVQYMIPLIKAELIKDVAAEKQTAIDSLQL